jgi:tetratricopeptide (TPR) repeat protein
MRLIAKLNAAALLCLVAAHAGAAAPDAQALYDRGDYAACIATLSVQLKEHPDDVAARILLGRALLGQKKTAEAVDRLEEAVARAPDMAEAHYALGQALAIRVNEVNFIRQSMMAGDIRRAFQRAVALDPKDVNYREALFEFYRQAPAIAGGGLDKAAVEAEALAKLDAAAGHRARGALALADGKVEQAEAEYREAMRAAPKNPDAYFELGQLHQKNGKYDAAFGDFEALLKQVPGYMPAEYQIGKTAVLSGQRLQRGETALKKYLSYVPKPDEPPLSWAHTRLGAVYQKMQRIGDARREFEAALALDSSLEEAKKALASLPK